MSELFSHACQVLQSPLLHIGYDHESTRHAKDMRNEDRSRRRSKTHDVTSSQAPCHVISLHIVSGRHSRSCTPHLSDVGV
ncbi:hypothetical protein EB796_008958 [Bugula neritina]|uniref:Uncharacterized protein n=1 Tax=Bugula neritina TaxID=10212 RepID=A0A7J7K272_BUGNE|nr:hypothetical protein EB796_008958 [Bugula neritina]